MGKVTVRFTGEQEEVLEWLIGIYGTNLAEVIKTLVLMKLDERGLLRKACEKRKLGVEA